jgi:hypothetical protein
VFWVLLEVEVVGVRRGGVVVGMEEGESACGGCGGREYSEGVMCLSSTDRTRVVWLVGGKMSDAAGRATTYLSFRHKKRLISSSYLNAFGSGYRISLGQTETEMTEQDLQRCWGRAFLARCPTRVRKT